ncbi:pyrimidine reductase family protein [Mycobacterium sp. 1423905.2]|uniref:pyrimidine reductase family protein n=1 Tax=Mycobacterium sp. 1423905.2 TaxID=1856859 RepID=UPI0007FC096A|nr:pyrimidine reductase family protein [Mycobacterium sp. 1423905.2]OBJ53764.1 hypothetical protein A9W95_17920 [Mycobacterium sp. 1423905.2]
MPDSAAGSSRLTLLGSEREVSDGELAQLYGYPAQHDGSWLRANFITSVDGGATVDGTSGAMGDAGDRLIFNTLRGLADVILVGAGTVRSEGYSGAHLGVVERQQRQARHQREVPPLAIVTKSGRLDRDLPIFSRTEVAPLVLTCTAALDETRRRLGPSAETIDCSGDDPARVDERLVLSHLEARGLRRVLTEGGPMLLGALIERDLLDELCLTVAPCVVGGRSRRIATGPAQLMTRLRCAHVLTNDAGYLYTRYIKA